MTEETGAGEAVVTETVTNQQLDSAFGGVQYNFINDTWEGPIANNNSTNIPLTMTCFSSVFGCGQDKYFPLSAMNGFHLLLTLNTAATSFQIDEGSTTNKTIAYSLNDPTIYTNMIRVDPAVDRGFIDASRGTDGRI